MEQAVVDLQRDELMARAQAALDTHRGKATVFFKFTCSLCDERLVLTEPNRLRAEGECWRCGTITTIEKGWFMLVLGDPVMVEIAARRATDA